MTGPTPTTTTGRLARLGRYAVAAVTALQLLVGVLAGGAVIGSFLVPGGSSTPTPQYEALSPGAPMRIRLPTLKVAAPVVPIAMSGRILDPPRDYREVGWWNASAKPGDPDGQTVITGHTVHTGGASMNRLGELEKADLVDVVTKRGTMRYVVTEVVVLTKERLAARAQGIFGQDRGRGRLVLITCTDWDGHDYRRNIVVFAKPLGSPRSTAA